jgi:hypothetical protein
MPPMEVQRLALPSVALSPPMMVCPCPRPRRPASAFFERHYRQQPHGRPDRHRPLFPKRRFTGERVQAGQPPGGNDQGQSPPGYFLGVGKQALLDQGQAGEIHVVTASAPGRLGDPILHAHHRPTTVDDDRAIAAKAVQGRRVQGVELHRGHLTVERRRKCLAPGQVACSDADLAGARFPEFGDNNASRCAVAADNSETNGPAHVQRPQGTSGTKTGPSQIHFFHLKKANDAAPVSPISASASG